VKNASIGESKNFARGVQNYFSKGYYCYNILGPSHSRAVLTRVKKAFPIIEHAKLYSATKTHVIASAVTKLHEACVQTKI